MEIHKRDREIAIAFAVIAGIWIVTALFILDLPIRQVVVITILLLVIGAYGYSTKRKRAILVSVMNDYEKKRKIPVELKAAMVQAAYGQYRLALVSFKNELEKNPNDKDLEQIVSLIEQYSK